MQTQGEQANSTQKRLWMPGWGESSVYLRLNQKKKAGEGTSFKQFFLTKSADNALKVKAVAELVIVFNSLFQFTKVSMISHAVALYII